MRLIAGSAATGQLSPMEEILMLITKMLALRKQPLRPDTGPSGAMREGRTGGRTPGANRGLRRGRIMDPV